MTESRAITIDAAYMILYIGLSAAMLALSAALVTCYAVQGELAPVQIGVGGFNLAGWIALPFAPSLYRSLTGRPFSWRSHEPFGAAA